MGAKVGHVVTPETRAKLSAALKGRPNPAAADRLKGRAQSPDLIQRRAEAQRRRSPICVIPGCGKPHNSRGWCSMHYYRWRLHGDPLARQEQPTGPSSARWKGNEITYSAAHYRAKTALPRLCQACGTTDGRLEIALRKDADPERLRTHPRDGSPYSPDPSDYARLCVTCHRRYDSPRPDTRAPIIEALGSTR